MLHNFAGNIEMYGILDAIASGPIDARTSENSTMVRYPFQSLSCLKLSIFFAFICHMVAFTSCHYAIAREIIELMLRKQKILSLSLGTLLV